MDADTHLRLLGEATGRSQQLELGTTRVLARALPTSDSRARLLLTAMGQGATFSVLQLVVDRNDCGSLDPVALGDWLKVAKAANQACNRVIHSPWVREDGDDEPTFVLTRTGALEPRTEEDLRRDIETLTAAVLGALTLL